MADKIAKKKLEYFLIIPIKVVKTPASPKRGFDTIQSITRNWRIKLLLHGIQAKLNVQNKANKISIKKVNANLKYEFKIIKFTWEITFLHFHLIPNQMFPNGNNKYLSICMEYFFS